VSCGGPPEVTINQLDTVHGVANPFKITKYDDVACKIKVEEQEPFPIMSERLHGGFCLSKEDYSKVKAYIEADCRNKRDERNRTNQIGTMVTPVSHGGLL